MTCCAATTTSRVRHAGRCDGIHGLHAKQCNECCFGHDTQARTWTGRPGSGCWRGATCCSCWQCTRRRRPASWTQTPPTTWPSSPSGPSSQTAASPSRQVLRLPCSTSPTATAVSLYGFNMQPNSGQPRLVERVAVLDIWSTLGAPTAEAPGDDEEGEEGAEPPWQDALLDVQLALLSRPAGALPSAPLRDAVEALFRATCHLLTSTGPPLPHRLVHLTHCPVCVLLFPFYSDGCLHPTPPAGTAARQVQSSRQWCAHAQCAWWLHSASCGCAGQKAPSLPCVGPTPARVVGV